MMPDTLCELGGILGEDGWMEDEEQCYKEPE